MKYWCELAWLGGDTPESGVAIEVDQGVITAVESGIVDSPEGARVLEGLTIPGLANAHSHAFQRALRGGTHRGTGDFWTWRDQMYSTSALIDPDNYLNLARATFGEMALAGITAVGEFHYLHHGPDGIPYEDPNAMGESLIEAARQVGIRITLIDTCYLHGGIGLEPDSDQRRFVDRDVDAWSSRATALVASPSVTENPLARVGAAIHSVRAVDPRSAGEVADWARKNAAPLHAHVSEQPAENEACLAAYSQTPTEFLTEAGATDQLFTAVHATHMTDHDIELLANSTACLCPTTERDLADGIGDARQMKDRGTRLSLGSDSNALIDIFEESRAMELNQRLATGRRGNHSPGELLEAATGDGYRSLGWPKGGRIEAGGAADLVTVSLDGVNLAGTSALDAIASLVFAAGARDVTTVIVAGETVVEDGAHVSVEVKEELDQSIRAVRP